MQNFPSSKEDIIMSAMIQNLKSLNDLVNLAHTLDHATAHEVYYPSGDASRFRVIKNDATNREVCTISDRYSILQHNDALNLILTGIEAAGITGGGVLRNYHNNIIVETFFDNLTIRDHSQDSYIQLGMRFTNSFDKSIGFTGGLTGWRQICSNGMLLGRLLPNAPHISFNHCGDVVKRITDSMMNFVESVIKMEGSLLTIINEAREEIITFESHDQLIRFTSQFVGSERRANQIFEIEPIELETTKWSIYNALTSYASHTDTLSYNQYEKINVGAEKLLGMPNITLPDMRAPTQTPLLTV